MKLLLARVESKELEIHFQVIPDRSIGGIYMINFKSIKEEDWKYNNQHLSSVSALSQVLRD